MTRRALSEKSALESYRLLASPDAEARERMLRGLSQRIAAGSLPSLIVPGPPTQLARLANAVPAFASRLLVLGGVVGGCTWAVVSAWLYLAKPEAPPPRAASGPRVEAKPVSRAPSPAEQLEVASQVPAVQLDAQAAHVSQSATRLKQGAPRHVVRRRESAGVKQQDVPQPSAAVAVPQDATPKRRELDEELKLIRSAYNALRAGNPEFALDQLARHAARYPDGELAESREVTRMIALCQAGKTEAARSQAASFLARSPNSPYSARVRLICSEPAKPSRP